MSKSKATEIFAMIFTLGGGYFTLPLRCTKMGFNNFRPVNSLQIGNPSDKKLVNPTSVVHSPSEMCQNCQKGSRAVGQQSTMVGGDLVI